jgi:ABC-type transport system substrate-binding protein
MKKLVSLCIGIILLVSLMVPACSNSSTTTPVTSAPATTAKATVPSATTPAATSSASAKPTTPATSATASVPAANKYGGILKLPLTVGPSTPLGYMAEAANDSYSYSKPALEPLVGLKLGGIVSPVLATSWDIDPAAKTMVFHLRKGVKFHDGSDFNAAVVKWNYDLMMAAKKAPNFDSVVVVDDYTIKITVKKYQNTDLTGMSSGAFNIISKASFDKNGIEYTRTHPVGTGPFKFVEYVRDSKLTYTKNPDYWDTGKPYVDGVVYNVVAEETVRKIMFQRGDLHIFQAQGIVAQELQKSGAILKSQPGGSFGLIPDSGNTASPFSKLAVRQAVSYAIDRKAFAEGLGFGFLNPGYQMYGGYAVSAIPGLVKTPFDPVKAKQLLADAGYPTGFKTSIHTFTRLIPNDWVTALAKMLGDVGIQTEGDFPTAGKYEEYRSQGWNNSLMAHGFVAPDNFNSFFNLYFPTTNIAFPSVKKPEGFAAAADASVTSPQVDPAKVQAAFKLMNDDLMVVPYAEQMQAQFYLKGVNDPDSEEYPLISLQYKDIWLDPIAR